MDEPELHLHPRALVEFIQWLYQDEKVEGLWVASHSLFLVPLFQFQEVIFFENSAVMPHNSHMYHQLYDDLIGIQYVDIYEFLKSLDNWQYYRFIVECFCLPSAVSKASSKDEQFQTFKTIAKSLNPNGVLLLLEVQTLSYGEQPYGNTGYLILSNQEVQELFPSCDIECSIKLAGEKSECWIIPRTAIEQISLQNIENCITCLSNSSKSILEKLFYSKVESAKQGNTVQDKTVQLAARKYAFFSQQYINAILSIDRLKKFKDNHGASFKQGKILMAKEETQPNDTKPLDFPGLAGDDDKKPDDDNKNPDKNS